MSRWSRFSVQRLALVRVLAGLALVLTVTSGGFLPAIAQGSDINLNIGAPPHSSVWVTTTDGAFLGSCTVNESGGAWVPSCGIRVPHPSTVLIHLDESTLSPGSIVEENPITFNTSNLHGRDSWGGAPHFQVSQGSVQMSSNIAVVTTADGAPFFDACFVLVDFSNVGCDVNRDGMITFAEIPPGTYTLRQVNDLGGLYMPDTTITVSGAAEADGWERFYVSLVGSSDGAPSSDPVDIALITRDPATGELLTDVCYLLVGYSNEGCDANEDGQVTFAEIPPGIYTVRQTQTPAGHPTINEYEINVDNSHEIPLGFLVRQAPEQNEPNTRNVSVVFVDSQTNTRLESDICVELVGASNIGCDEDLRDGQVDFLDVPAGEWPIAFSNIPEGWAVEKLDAGEGAFIDIDTDPSAPSHQMVFLNVNVSAEGNVGGVSMQESTGNGGYEQLLGQWHGKRRVAEFFPDGTGTVQYSLMAPTGAYIIFHVVVDTSTLPTSATIVDITTGGDIDPTQYPTIGDALLLRLEPFPNGHVLVVTVEEGWEMWVCHTERVVDAGDVCAH